MNNLVRLIGGVKIVLVNVVHHDHQIKHQLVLNNHQLVNVVVINVIVLIVVIMDGVIKDSVYVHLVILVIIVMINVNLDYGEIIVVKNVIVVKIQHVII